MTPPGKLQRPWSAWLRRAAKRSRHAFVSPPASEVEIGRAPEPARCARSFGTASRCQPSAQFEEFVILADSERQEAFAALVADLHSTPISLRLLLVLRSDYQTAIE